MKELVVILSLILSGHFGVQIMLEQVNRFDLFGENLNDLVIDPRFTGFEIEQPITATDLRRYNQAYGLPNHSGTGSMCSADDRMKTSPVRGTSSRDLRSLNSANPTAVSGI